MVSYKYENLLKCVYFLAMLRIPEKKNRGLIGKLQKYCTFTAEK